MKVAIMQPYVFPYLGYFQLVNAVDKFIFFNDVNYIKKGWINKNTILVNNAPHKFSIPVKDSSQNKLISEVELSDYDKWSEKFMKTFFSSYKQAPHFKMVSTLISAVIQQPHKTIEELAISSVKSIATYLELATQFERSSEIDYDRTVESGEKKIIDICRIQHAETYINPYNGRDLYDASVFRQHNLQLNFIRMDELSYMQFQKEKFVPSLSIIDVLMFNDKDEIKNLLKKNTLE